MVLCIAVISINNKKVLGDALSSQDEHISLIEYQPLLKLMRQSRQDVRFNRSPAVPGYPKDDYGSGNEIISLPKFTYPSAKSYPGSITYNYLFCIHTFTIVFDKYMMIYDLILVAADTCPKIDPLPAYECSKRRTRKMCWSVGQADVDCPTPNGHGYGLCCFDGCTNSCRYKAKALGNVFIQANDVP